LLGSHESVSFFYSISSDALTPIRVWRWWKRKRKSFVSGQQKQRTLKVFMVEFWKRKKVTASSDTVFSTVFFSHFIKKKKKEETETLMLKKIVVETKTTIFELQLVTTKPNQKPDDLFFFVFQSGTFTKLIHFT